MPPNPPMTEEQWHDVPRPGDVTSELWRYLNPTYLPRKAIEASLPYTPMGHAVDILYNRETQAAYRDVLGMDKPAASLARARMSRQQPKSSMSWTERNQPTISAGPAYGRGEQVDADRNILAQRLTAEGWNMSSPADLYRLSERSDFTEEQRQGFKKRALVKMLIDMGLIAAGSTVLSQGGLGLGALGGGIMAAPKGIKFNAPTPGPSGVIE
jgi:hypothetical protein